MNCPKCGTFHQPEAAFCTSCGTKIQVLSCQTCHHPNLFSARFCVKCGTNLQAPIAAPLVEEGLSERAVNTLPESPLSDAEVPQQTMPVASDGKKPLVSVQQTVNGEFRYAGFWARFAAYLIDQILLLIAVGIVGALFSLALVRKLDDPSLLNLFPQRQIDYSTLPLDRNLLALFAGWYYAYFLYAMLRWVYFSVMESSPLQATLGKMLLGIKVTDMRGDRLKFGRAVGRYFSKIISNMTLYIGYIMAAGTKRKQALHDLIAECLVVRK